MTPENLREKIAEIKKEYEIAFPKDFYAWSEYGFWLEKLSDIASLISQHSENKGEQLKVNLTYLRSTDEWMLLQRRHIFKTKEQSIDFCKRFNLKMVRDE